MSQSWTLGLGSAFVYDGGLCTVVELTSDAVVIQDSNRRLRRLRLVDIVRAPRDGGKAHALNQATGDAESDGVPLGIIWAEASESAREESRRRADHVRELLTGYRSGSVDVRRRGEPRPEYDVGTSVVARQRAKAKELGIQPRTIARWTTQYLAMGEAGLIDGRRARRGAVLANLDPRWIDTARMILDEQASGSKIAKKVVIDRIDARLSRTHSGEEVRRPGRTLAYSALDEIDEGRSTFVGPTKRKRSNKNRPDPPYGRLIATRPGEYVLLDTTPLNVFAVAPVTGEWLPVELTVAIDLYSRCILGLRLTPGSTKSIDVSGVLLEALLPFEAPSDWAESAQWPYHGIPQSLILDPAKVRVSRFERAGLLPETIVVDHGRPFLSDHVTSACARLGISIQPARVYQPTDKGAVERFFRSLDTLLQELPGYKGADIAGRGADIESEAVYTIPQLEQIIREWTASIYHLRPHSALVDPNMPGIVMSPVQRYEQGIATAGRLRMPNDRDAVLELLPVVRRQFHHYGVEIARLRYTGPIVAKYRNRSRSRSREHASDWPFFVNPDDLSHIYFHDPEDSTWHTLTWEHHSALGLPFSLDALEYAKRLALQPGHTADIQKTLAALLEQWGADRALTPAERRIKARAVALATEIASDAVNSLATVQRILGDRTAGTDSLTDELVGRTRTPDASELQSPPGDDDFEDELDDSEFAENYYHDAMEQL